MPANKSVAISTIAAAARAALANICHGTFTLDRSQNQSDAISQNVLLEISSNRISRNPPGNQKKPKEGIPVTKRCKNFQEKYAQTILVGFCIIFLILNSHAWGSKMDTKWISRMKNDVEQAVAASEKAKGSFQEKEDAAANAAKKYFPVGMSAEDAAAMLIQLKENGFSVREYHPNGTRDWPEGKLQAYGDEATRINMENQYTQGTYGIIATKTWKSRFIVEEFYSIILKVSKKANNILEASANRSAKSF